MYKEALEKHKSQRKAAKALGLSRTAFITRYKKELGLCLRGNCTKKPREGRVYCEEHGKSNQDMERKKQKNKEWREKNREYCNQKGKEYYWANHEKQRAYHNARMKKPENRLKERLRRQEHRRNRADRPKACLTCGQAIEIQNKFENKCFKCGAADRLEFDHHIPLSKGGVLEPGNIVILCKSCNSRKRDKDPEEFYSPLELEKLNLLLSSILKSE